MESLVGREIIFETRLSGNFAQVCAIDCATGIEVFVTTPVNAARSDQQALALRKLAKALSDNSVLPHAISTKEKSDTTLNAPPSSKRGLLA